MSTAKPEHGGVKHAAQVEIHPFNREKFAGRPVLDEQGFPLIPHDKLFFVDPAVVRRGGVTWKPPRNCWDAMRYGRDVALDLLRIAPEGCRTRSMDVQVIAGIYLLEQQFANGIPHEKSGAHAATYAFWSAMLRFIFVAPTHENVEAYRAKTTIMRLEDEIGELRHQLRRRRRKPTKRGKAVRS